MGSSTWVRASSSTPYRLRVEIIRLSATTDFHHLASYIALLQLPLQPGQNGLKDDMVLLEKGCPYVRIGGCPGPWLQTALVVEQMVEMPQGHKGC